MRLDILINYRVLETILIQNKFELNLNRIYLKYLNAIISWYWILDTHAWELEMSSNDFAEAVMRRKKKIFPLLVQHLEEAKPKYTKFIGWTWLAKDDYDRIYTFINISRWVKREYNRINTINYFFWRAYQHNLIYSTARNICTFYTD